MALNFKLAPLSTDYTLFASHDKIWGNLQDKKINNSNNNNNPKDFVLNHNQVTYQLKQWFPNWGPPDSH